MTGGRNVAGVTVRWFATHVRRFGGRTLGAIRPMPPRMAHRRMEAAHQIIGLEIPINCRTRD